MFEFNNQNKLENCFMKNMSKYQNRVKTDPVLIECITTKSCSTFQK